MKPTKFMLTLLVLLFVSCYGYHEGGVRYSIFDDLKAKKQLGFLVNNTDKFQQFEIHQIKMRYYEYKCGSCDTIRILKGKKDVLPPSGFLNVERLKNQVGPPNTGTPVFNRIIKGPAPPGTYENNAVKLFLKPGWYLIKLRAVDSNKKPLEEWRMFHKNLPYKRPHDKGPFTWEYE